MSGRKLNPAILHLVKDAGRGGGCCSHPVSFICSKFIELDIDAFYTLIICTLPPDFPNPSWSVCFEYHYPCVIVKATLGMASCILHLRSHSVSLCSLSFLFVLKFPYGFLVAVCFVVNLRYLASCSYCPIS